MLRSVETATFKADDTREPLCSSQIPSGGFPGRPSRAPSFGVT